MYFIWYIIIGIIAGFVAGKLMRGGGFGLFINLLVGIVGGVLGGWVFGLFGIAYAEKRKQAMDFRHLIVTCLFSKLRLPFDNQKVKENYAILTCKPLVFSWI